MHYHKRRLVDTISRYLIILIIKSKSFVCRIWGLKQQRDYDSAGEMQTVKPKFHSCSSVTTVPDRLFYRNLVSLVQAWIRMQMPEPARNRNKGTQSGNGMLRNWTEMSDAGMQMPAASALMPMPTFGILTRLMTSHAFFLVCALIYWNLIRLLFRFQHSSICSRRQWEFVRQMIKGSPKLSERENPK